MKRTELNLITLMVVAMIVAIVLLSVIAFQGPRLSDAIEKWRDGWLNSLSSTH